MTEFAPKSIQNCTQLIVYEGVNRHVNSIIYGGQNLQKLEIKFNFFLILQNQFFLHFLMTINFVENLLKFLYKLSFLVEICFLNLISICITLRDVSPSLTDYHRVENCATAHNGW